MSREVRMELNEDQYEMLSEIKERRGYTWKGMLLQAGETVQERPQPERFEGLTYDDEKDRRVFPDLDSDSDENDRLGSFKAGWTEAEKGKEYGADTLETLSWHNLGWRLGKLFGDSSPKLKRELYEWSVRQQRESRE